MRGGKAAGSRVAGAGAEGRSAQPGSGPTSCAPRRGRIELLLAAAVLLLAGCRAPRAEPFEEFRAAVRAVHDGTDLILSDHESAVAARTVHEAARAISVGEPARIQSLYLETEPPLTILSAEPLFLATERFRLANAQLHEAMEGYAALLLELASPELLSESTFRGLADEVNANAAGALAALGVREDAGGTALISTATEAALRAALESRRRAELAHAVRANQPAVEAYTAHALEGVELVGIAVLNEYRATGKRLRDAAVTTKSAYGTREAAVRDLMELDRALFRQVNDLRRIRTVLARVPAAHAELAAAAEDASLSTQEIRGLYEEGRALRARFEARRAANAKRLAEEAGEAEDDAAKD